MAIAEELQIIVDAKVTQAIRDMNRVGRTIDGTAKTTNKLSDTFKKLAGPAALGAVVFGLAKVGKELIKAASDAEETSNKFSVVFGTVADESEAAADRIKDEFKLSDETVESFLSGVGDITSGLGATSEEALQAAESITTLGLDINSFANLSGGAEQAVKALTSLFTGEREAAKALGIVINDTNLKAYAEDMGKVFKELTPLEKGFLSLELATTQSELAIGDFARSSGSYANTMKAATEATKDLKAALGESLLPAATAGVGIFAEYAAKIAEVVKQHNELQDIVSRFDAGTASAQDRVDIAQNEVEILRNKLRIRKDTLANLVEEGAISQRLVDAAKEQITILTGQLRTASDIASHYSKIAKEEKALADAEKTRFAELEKMTELELEAGSLLDSRRKSRLTDEDKLLQSLNDQIDTWAKFRKVVGVQELLNDLVKERNELIGEEKTAIQAAADDRLRIRLMTADAIAAREERLADEQKERLEETAAAWKNFALNVLSSSTGLFGSIDSLVSASATHGILELERGMRARLEAAGLSEATEKERLDRELDAAIASGDTKTAEEKEDALARLAITSEFEKEKARIEYRAALASWSLQLASAIASGAAGVARTIASVPFPYNIPLGILQGAAAGIQIAAVSAAKPVPAFAQGGIVPGSSFSGDNVPASVNSGEMILNGVQQENLFNLINNPQNSNNGGGTMILNIDGRQFTGWLQSQLDNGQLRLPRRAII